MKTQREIKGEINSENPETHWRFLPVENETIVDLGCGINNQEFLPTPLYWIQNKAKFVVGVDPDINSYNWFKQNYWLKNYIHVMDFIDRTEKFELYIGYYKPSVVKIDVEGSEVFFNAINSDILNGVRHIGIEYHNLSCLLSCESKLLSNNYEIDYYKFPNLDIDHQGVLHAYKKNIVMKKAQTPDEHLTQELNKWRGGVNINESKTI
jgi:hypothetical protein